MHISNLGFAALVLLSPVLAPLSACGDSGGSSFPQGGGGSGSGSSDGVVDAGSSEAAGSFFTDSGGGSGSSGRASSGGGSNSGGTSSGRFTCMGCLNLSGECVAGTMDVACGITGPGTMGSVSCVDCTSLALTPKCGAGGQCSSTGGSSGGSSGASSGSVGPPQDAGGGG